MHSFIYPLWEPLSSFVEPSPTSHRRGHFFAHEMTAQKDSTMPKLSREHPAVVTVKLSPQHLAKLDSIAAQLHRSRADMMRAMIAHTELTGLPDIRVTGIGDHPLQDNIVVAKSVERG
jgi:hypothetical protein